MFTAWGYEIGGSGIPPLLTSEAFDRMTGGKYAGDLRAASALSAASQAVRNACGWHVSPSIECTARLTADGKVVKLPANHVCGISSLREDGRELADGSDFEWRHDGLVRRACFREFSRGWDAIEVVYTAGYDVGAVDDLAQAVAGIAEAVLLVPVGVNSESADGVTISYSAQAQGIANAMTEQFLAQLAPYRLVSSHAA